MLSPWIYSPQQLEDYLRMHPKAKSFYCVGKLITDSTIENLVSRHIRIKHIILNNTATGDRAVQAITNYCRDLQQIGIINTQATEPALIRLVKYCTNLQGVDFSSSPFAQAGTAALARHCGNKLISLSVSDTAVQDADMRHILHHCRNLKYVAASCNDSIGNDTAAALGQYCSDIISVDLSFTNVSDSGIAAMVTRSHRIPLRKNLPAEQRKVRAHRLCKLHSLNLAKTLITSKAIIAVANNCPGLVSITLTATDTDDSAMAALSHCKKLTNIGLAWTNVTVDGCWRLLANNTRRQSIELQGIASVDDAFITQLLTFKWPAPSPFAKLKKIGLCGTSVTCSSAHALAHSCSELQDVELGRPDIKDCGLAAIAHSANRNLKTICVNDAKNITDAGAIAVASNCPELKAAYFSRTGITNTGVIALLLDCPKLTHLEVDGTAVTTDLLPVLRQHAPKLRHFSASRTRIRQADVEGLSQDYPSLQIYVNTGDFSTDESDTIFDITQTGIAITTTLA